MVKTRQTIPEKVLGSIIAGASIPTMQDICEQFFEECGGQKQFARLLHLQLEKSPVGSIARTQILSIIMTMLGKLKDAGGDHDLGLLSDADLEQSLEEIMGKMLKSEELQETS